MYTSCETEHNISIKKDAHVMICNYLSHSAERTIPEAVLTHSAGIHIFVIGIGLTGDTPEIQALATAPAEQNRHLVNTFDDLVSVRRQIFAKICDSRFNFHRITFKFT